MQHLMDQSVFVNACLGKRVQAGPAEPALRHTLLPYYSCVDVFFFSISVELTLKQGGGEKAKKESSPYLLQP